MYLGDYARKVATVHDQLSAAFIVSRLSQTFTSVRVSPNRPSPLARPLTLVPQYCGGRHSLNSLRTASWRPCGERIL